MEDNIIVEIAVITSQPDPGPLRDQDAVLCLPLPQKLFLGGGPDRCVPFPWDSPPLCRHI